MKTRLTDQPHFRIAILIFILALFSISSRPAHSQSTVTTLTLKPGATLKVGQSLPLSSIATLQRSTDSTVVGADIAINAPDGVTITGAGYSGPQFNYYYATLFGDIALGICCGNQRAMPWDSVILTPTQSNSVSLTGYIGEYRPCFVNDAIWTVCRQAGQFQLTIPMCAANCLSLDFVDAVSFASVIPVNGFVDANAAAGLAKGGRSRVGVAADGVAGLVIRATTSVPGQVAFSLQGTSGYDSGILDVSSSSASTIAINGTNMAFAFYTAPLDYAQSLGESSLSRQVQLTAVFTPSSGGTSVTKNEYIEIVRPPVVLVHGFASSSLRWIKSGFRDGLTNAIPGLNVFLADYSNPKNQSTDHFAANANIPNQKIVDALNHFNDYGYAAAQADVIGHSMGGLLSRIWTQSASYGTIQNNMKGNIHKLITIATPHLGAFRADQLALYMNNNTITGFLNLIGKSITNGGMADMETTSEAIQNMNIYSWKSNTPASVLVGNGNDWATCFPDIFGVFSAVGITLPTYGPANDTIVSVTSQKASGPPPVLPLPYCHTDIIFHADAVNQAVKLLNAHVGDFTYFAPFTDGLESAQAKPTVRAAVATHQTVAGQSSSLSITSPLSGAVFAPGSQVTVTTQASNGFNPVSIMILARDLAVQSSSNFAAITIPDEIAGALTILAVGTDAGGAFQSAQVSVQVSPTAALNSISASPSFVQLSPQQSAQLDVVGYYSDNVARDVTQLATTTYHSSNTKVATIDQAGVVTAVGPGTSWVLVSNSNQTVAVQINGEGTPAGAPNTHDLNGDGHADITWMDGNGDVGFWLMNGATPISYGGVNSIPSAWSIVGQRDFNGDGMADLLWHDTSGNTAIWFMNGATVSSAVSVGAIPISWSVAGTGDFNGDGMGDILWRDSTGNLAIWLMNGGTISSGAGLGNVPTNWNVVGTGDFNGDGKTDLLWQDNLGNTAIWFMNGTSIASTGGLGTIPTSWSIVGTGDFNADGMTDIVWRDTAGDTSIWLMNGSTISSAGGVGTVPTTWSIALVGDYNGDGMSDLLWRDTSGNTAMWFMNGTTIASTAGVGNVPTHWTVQSINAE